MKKSILFIINPVSGGKHKVSFPETAARFLDKNRFRPQYRFTEYTGHASSLAHEAIKNNTDIIVAVGGDGTINEVATVLQGTESVMGIIPCGSGNGLARSLGIPLSNRNALSVLNRGADTAIDSAFFNNRSFFNMAGIGFDAHISARFAHDHTRGLKGYVRTTLTEIAGYKPEQYDIMIDGQLYQREAFMLSIANSSQYGNNAHVAPHASVKDGLLDVCIIKPFPLYHFPAMGYHLFSKTAHKSKYVEIIQGKEISISREKPGPVHLDGEPYHMEEKISIRIEPASLRILV